jgi:hypothetical protein
MSAESFSITCETKEKVKTLLELLLTQNLSSCTLRIDISDTNGADRLKNDLKKFQIPFIHEREDDFLSDNSETLIFEDEDPRNLISEDIEDRFLASYFSFVKNKMNYASKLREHNCDLLVRGPKLTILGESKEKVELLKQIIQRVCYKELKCFQGSPYEHIISICKNPFIKGVTRNANVFVRGVKLEQGNYTVAVYGKDLETIQKCVSKIEESPPKLITLAEYDIQTLSHDESTNLEEYFQAKFYEKYKKKLLEHKVYPDFLKYESKRTKKLVFILSLRGRSNSLYEKVTNSFGKKINEIALINIKLKREINLRELPLKAKGKLFYKPTSSKTWIIIGKAKYVLKFFEQIEKNMIEDIRIRLKKTSMKIKDDTAIEIKEDNFHQIYYPKDNMAIVQLILRTFCEQSKDYFSHQTNQNKPAEDPSNNLLSSGNPNFYQIKMSEDAISAGDFKIEVIDLNEFLSASGILCTQQIHFSQIVKLYNEELWKNFEIKRNQIKDICEETIYFLKTDKDPEEIIKDNSSFQIELLEKELKMDNSKPFHRILAYLVNIDKMSSEILNWYPLYFFDN